MPINDSMYDRVFYRYQREGAVRSARLIVPLLHEVFKVESVLDVGCGAGAWLRAHKEAGATDLLGVDGDYVDRSLLVIDPALFRCQDVTARFDLGRMFDLVQCLEVGEHVPPPTGRVLVDNIVRHGRNILFSAAPPGQGGKGHINEQTPDYWRALFAERGYVAFDFVRPRIAQDRRVEWWYRYNTLVYVHEANVPSLPGSVRDSRVVNGAPIRDISPPAIRARKTILRTLPAGVVSWLATMKHRRFVRSLK